MRIYLLCFLIQVMAVGGLNAQHYCGFDESKDLFLSHNKRVAQHQRHLDQVDHWLEQNKGLNRDELTCVVPVVVHVIHQNGGENIPDEMVEDAIGFLNAAFSNLDVYYSPQGTVVPIQFCLAHVDPDGNLTTGINRVESQLTTVTIPDQESDLKDLSRWDTERYMNVWIVNELIRAENSLGIIGNSTLPGMHGSDTDGLIIEAAFFGGTAVQTKVFIHEVGHYLGLFHTFEGSCNNDDCLVDGDRVCDTPPDGIVAPLDCSNGTNSCETDDDDLSENNPFRPIGNGGLGDQIDQQQNYMDYSPLTCYEYFTLGQCDRMLAALLTTRASLLDGDRCNLPCTSNIETNVSASANVIFIDEVVVFTNNSVGITNTTWMVNEETVSTDTNFEFSPVDVGTYFIEVLLQNSEPGCTIELEFNIEVNCPVIPFFTSSSLNVQPEDVVSFVNFSSGADSYQWYLDGSNYSEDEDISIEFDNLGSYQVCVEAFSGSCSSIYCSTFDVGTCSTGEENSQWFLYTGESLLNKMIFNEGNTSYQNFYLDYSENKATICDNNGNLLFTTDGENLYNQNLLNTPNGFDLFGHFSSRKGALFVNAPGSDDLVYLFTLDAYENSFENGLRYNLINKSLDNGNGDIIPEFKNVLIDQVATETMTAIRHCNYIDFWLVYYDSDTEQFISWYVSEEGISSDPVLSPYSASNFNQNNIYYMDMKVSPRGDKFAKGNILFSFDNGSGQVSEFLNYSDETVSYYDFAPNGRFFYAQVSTILNQVQLRQYDLSLPVNDIVTDVFFVNQPIFAAYSDIHTAPSGQILLASIFSGTLDRIGFPNLYGSDMELQYSVLFDTGFLNGFGNYYHAYTTEEIFIDGTSTTCKGAETTFELIGCPQGTIDWTVTPQASVSQNQGQIEVIFPSVGLYQIEVSLQTECGILRGEMDISVTEGIEPDLGPDMNICVGEALTLSPGGGYATYEWSNESTEEAITISLPGSYSVEVTNSEGCTYSDEIEINQLISGTIDLGPDFDFCDTVIVLNAGNQFQNYVWQDGTTGSTYTVFEPGTYSVSASVPCEASDEVVVVACTIGIEEYFDFPISVFPNPANDKVYIDMQGLSYSDAQYFLYDVTGRLVRENFISQIRTELNVADLALGLYSLKIAVDEQFRTFEICVR
jgi:hypothetical protein